MEPANSVELVHPKDSDDTMSTTSFCESEDEHITLSEDEEGGQDETPTQDEVDNPQTKQLENNKREREENELLDRSDIRSQTPTALVSSATLGQAPQEGQADSGLTREQKMSILRRLMKEVTLEETLAKYRCYSGPDRRSDALNESDQLKSFLSAESQQYLEMEGDILFVADREYMAKLETQLEKQYQSEMDKKEEERADLERQRMRRLMVEGVIGPEDLKEDGYMQGWNHNSRSRRGTIHGNKNKVWSPRRPTPGSAYWRSKSAPEPKTRHQPTPQPGGKNSRAHAQSAAVSGHAHRKGTAKSKGGNFNGDTQVARMGREERGNEGPREGRRLHFQRCFVHDEEGCNCDSERPERKEAFIKKYEDPIITQLKQDEITVDQMYELADTILPADRPKSYLDNTKGGKKKMTPAQERKRREMALMGVVRR